jgi:hypothetical protein
MDFALVDSGSFFQVAFPATTGPYLLGWEIASPRMVLKKQFYELVFQDGVVRLNKE